jgi:hypothetical protein
MTESNASRTLVKSPPELWSEVSSAASLQRHMDQFGEIRITKLEPETAVAWEGEHARGTIRLEPSGWGTKVSLSATPSTGKEAANEARQRDPAPDDRLRGQSEAELPAGLALPFETVETEMRELTVFLERNRREAELQKRRWPRRFARKMRRWFAPEPEDSGGPSAAQDLAPVDLEPEASASEVAPKPAPAPQTEPQGPEKPALDAVLDSLGQAHHRPYSRA